MSIALAIFNTVEFYVMAVMLAAAVVAFFARPRSVTAARQHLLPSVLSYDPAGDGAPSITITVADDNTVTITRHGLRDLTGDGALSLAIEVAGFDISIKERIVMGRGGVDAAAVNTATVTLDFLAPERYHLHYINPATELTAATTLPVKPGIVITKPLI